VNGRCTWLVALTMSTGAMAQVTPDASLGTNVNVSGQTWTISGGTIVGNENQFHSFSQFDLSGGEIADFTGPAGILNIVSRINNPLSMGMPSSIDGTIRSSVNGANLWIINPDGVVFGASSSLDVTGSFHVSSADYLLLEGGGQFFADPTSNSVLTVGNPSTFGFLQQPAGTIELDGAQLAVPDGETVSLVASQVEIHDGAALTAAGGRLNLVSVGSAGEVALLADGIDNSGISYVGDESVSMYGQSTLDVSGEGGGSIYIRGGQFTMGGSASDDETITANTEGATDGGVVDIDMAGDVSIQGAISANTSGSGAGGDISVSGQSIKFQDQAGGMGGQSLIEARTTTNSSGNAGSISLTAVDNIDLQAQLLVQTESSGDAGDINITAGSLDVDIQGQIASRSRGEGAGGDINIDVAGAINWQDGEIEAGSFVLLGQDPALSGPAGNITITADTFTLRSSGGLTISTKTNSGGAGGNILLDIVSDIYLGNGTIESSTTSGGSGGSITLRSATGNITLRQDDEKAARILATARENATGDAGSIVIEANSITISDEASVSAETSGAGNAGDISITATGLFELTGPASINSRSLGTGSGSAGTIAVTAGDVSIVSGGNISVFTQSNQTGNTPGRIDIHGTRSVTIDNSNLFDPFGNPALVATTSGSTAGGDIVISAPVVDIVDALILSSTSGAGAGGTIDITGDATLDLSGSILEAGTIAGSSGAGGSIALSGGDIVVHDSTALLANTATAARAGDIRISGENVDILDASIEAAAGTNGTGGNIDLSATNLLHVGDTADVVATTDGAGTGGTITLDSPDTIVDGFAVVSARTGGTGTGGSVQILGGMLTVTGDASLLATTSGPGTGGAVLADNASIVVEGNGLISANTQSTGAGGTVDIAADEVLVRENGAITADTDGAGTGGSIFIDAGEVSVIDGGQITASTGNDGNEAGGNIEISGGLLTVASGGRIEATTTGAGDGGSIRIVSDNVMLGPDSLVTVNASSDGNAGAIDIDAGETVVLDNARIESTSKQSNGGDISVNAGNLVHFIDSRIFASGAPEASGTPGDAGNIRLGMDGQPDSPAFLLFQGVNVSADAGGSGGAIDLFAQYMLGADYTFNAHSDTGNDGEITINVPATDFVSVISQLELPILNVADLLDDQCAVSALTDRSSFVIDTVGLPPSPEDYRSSGYYLSSGRPAAALPGAGETYVASVFKKNGC